MIILNWHLLHIRGHSMSPALNDGDYAIVKDLSSDQPLSVGDIVTFDHPDFGFSVKRIKAFRDTMLLLHGLDARSVEPTQIGWVCRKHILGRIEWQIAPSGMRKIANIEMRTETEQNGKTTKPLL